MQQIDERANDHTIDLKIDEILEVQLEENRTAGFQWQLSSSGEPACAPVNATGKAARPASPAQVGQARTASWQFQGRTPGQGKIVLLYQRPWQPDAPPQRTFTLWVTVAK